MKRNLFVVTEEGIFLGRARRHKDLAKMLLIPEDLISYGGGVFDCTNNNGVMVLFGKSFDFGSFDTAMVYYHINNSNVFWYGRPLRWQFDIRVDKERVEKITDTY